MTEEKKFQLVFDWLFDADAHLRLGALEFIADEPTGDVRLLPYVENLLGDWTITFDSIPPEYGEVRRFAAFALAAERATLGIDEIVHLPQTFTLYSQQTIRELVKKYELSVKGFGLEYGIACTWRLLEIGAIPLHDLALDPKDGADSFKLTRWNRYARKA